MSNWKRAIISQSASIRDALRAIDQGKLRTAFIVDNQNALVGLVVEGDIRRGLLDDLNMNDSIQKVWNLKPFILKKGFDKEEALCSLDKNDLQCLPVIDDDGLLIDVQTCKTLNQPESKSTPVFIMAGGFGTRLRPLTDECPKPMLPVAGKPMLERIVEKLKAEGFSNLYLSTHYLPGVIKNHFGDGSKWGVSISYIHEENPLGTGGAIGLLPEVAKGEPLLLINGDILTDISFSKFLNHHNKTNCDATMCVRQVEHQISYGVVESSDEHRILKFIEKPTFTHDINTGMYILSPSFLRSVRANIKVDIPDLIQQRILQGNVASVYKHAGYWLDIGRMTDYQKAQKDYLEVFGES